MVTVLRNTCCLVIRETTFISLYGHHHPQGNEQACRSVVRGKATGMKGFWVSYRWGNHSRIRSASFMNSSYSDDLGK
jgi:hypothetical protein